jgi:hypothetical protein
MNLNPNIIILLLNFILNFVLRIFLFENIWIKIFCILITGVIIYVIKYKYPFKRRFRKLSELRAYKKKDNFLKWGLFTRKDHIVNVIVLGGFALIFLVGFFILRFKNIGRDVDLKDIYTRLYNLLDILPNYVIVLDIILLINIFIIFIFIMREIRKHVKKEFIKRHLYSLSFSYEYPYNKYTNFIEVFSVKMFSKIRKIYRLSDDFLNDIVFKNFYKDFDEQLRNDKIFQDKINRYDNMRINIITHMLNHIHYYVLFFTLIIDLRYNNFHLIYLYKILPITFLYDLFLKYYNFIYMLSSYHDNTLKYGIYMFDDVEAMKDGIIYFQDLEKGIDANDFAIAVNVYLEAGLNYSAVQEHENKQIGRVAENKTSKLNLVILIIVTLSIIGGLIYFKLYY